MKNETNSSLSALQSSGERLTRDLVAVANETSALLKDTAGQQMQGARDAFVDARAAVGEHFDAASYSTQRYVRQNPWVALAVVGGAGLVLGLLLARR